MDINITQIVEALIGLLFSLITAYVIPWLKRKISAENQRIVLSVSDAVVLATEQLYKTLGGDVKKEQAMQAVGGWLKKYHITMDMDQIEAAVESSVKRMNIKIKGE